MTAAEMYERAATLEEEAREWCRRASELRQQELKARPLGERLIYAATSRCPCGAGLAYDPCQDDAGSVHVGPSYWDCSAILLGAADAGVQHTDRLPFAFYEVKSEKQASACGATTRPKAEVPS